MSVLLLKSIHQNQQLRKKRLRTVSSKHSLTDSMAAGATVTMGNNGVKTRHRKWQLSARQNYKLYKRGRHISSSREISNAFESGQLTHDYLWYFVHKDSKIERADRIEPKWIVVLCTDDGVYLHPQQPYLTAIYKQLKRTNYKKALEMMPDGTPYWVDTHIARIQRDKEAKKRYSEKQRKKQKKDL